MSKWTKVKAAMLAATSVVAALQFGGCLGGIIDLDRIMQLVAIGSIFD
jgi:hypothetical protein